MRARVRLAAVVGDPQPAGAVETGSAGVADRGAAAFVFVVGGDVADPGVQALGVVLVADRGELGSEDGGVADWSRCGQSALMWLNRLSIQA